MPLVVSTVEGLKAGRLEAAYPSCGPAPAKGTLFSDVIVVMLGGATYEEARSVAQARERKAAIVASNLSSREQAPINRSFVLAQLSLTSAADEQSGLPSCAYRDCHDKLAVRSFGWLIGALGWVSPERSRHDSSH